MLQQVRAFGTSLDECRHSSLDDRLLYLQTNPPKSYRQEWRRADELVQQLTVCPVSLDAAIPVEGPNPSEVQHAQNQESESQRIVAKKQEYLRERVKRDKARRLQGIYKRLQDMYERLLSGSQKEEPPKGK
jgi:hypothetical protein